MHLLVQCGEKPHWVKLRQTVHDYCYSVIPGPVAMDVGAITKGREKGKRKGKCESHGDGGKGKKGKKGKQAKNAEKSMDHDHFDGYCGSCGQWGHKQKHCWRNRKRPQVNHVSQDEQVASRSAHQQTHSSTLSAPPQTVSMHGAIAPFGFEEDEDGWVFGVEGHEGAISDHFVGANEFPDHGRPGTRVELMVDSGSTATVCGLEHFSDTPVTIGHPMRLRASSGQTLKHYGQKKVELLSDSGEKMHVTFSVHNVKRAIISTSATAPSGIETHLDEWDSQKGRTVSYFKKRTSGGTRWLNMMTRGGLYFLGATVACGQLQQTGAYPINCEYDHTITFPTWRTSGEVAPLDGDQERAPAEVAAGATSVEVAADADPANNQDPEADGGLNDGLAPTDPVAPPMSVGRRQPNEPTEAERLAHNRTHIPFADWCESCVRGRGRDDPHRARQDHVEGDPIPVVQSHYFFFKAEKEDILCKAISAIDSENNRTMALECEFKGLSDQAVPNHLKEYLKSLGFEKAQVQGDPEGALNNVLDRAIDGLSGWTRRQSPLKDKPAHGRVERFHATLEGLMRTWRNDVVKRNCASLPAHHPTVAWLVRHCA